MRQAPDRLCAGEGLARTLDHPRFSAFLERAPIPPQEARIASFLHPDLGKVERPHLCPAQALSQAQVLTQRSRERGPRLPCTSSPRALLFQMPEDKASTPRTTTMAFTCFVLFDLFNALTCRSQVSPQQGGIAASRPECSGGSSVLTVPFSPADQADLRDWLPPEPNVPLLRARLHPGTAGRHLHAAPAEGLPDGEPGGAG